MPNGVIEYVLTSHIELATKMLGSTVHSSESGFSNKSLKIQKTYRNVSVKCCSEDMILRLTFFAAKHHMSSPSYNYGKP